MKILFVYPENPSTFWSFRYALKFISKKSSEPPLGLLTVAAMLPEAWEKQLIDMNVSRLKDKHILWADYVFVTGMDIHKESFKNIVKRCNELGLKVIAGGPMCTIDHKEFEGVDHFILNEAEITLPRFLEDLKNGCPKPIYTSDEFPDISLSPIPKWDLLELKKYACMNIQYSRGCPFNCEFCCIGMLNGHKARTKSREQFLAELESIYLQNWRGSVFIVDDNFIGNKQKLKKEILPAMIEWSEKRNNPFSFSTELSIDLADDDELVKLMVEAGFVFAFIGIETPNDESLSECGKAQNLHRDMMASVKKLHRSGIMVSGGFIVGFDHDPPTIFEQQINFIQKSGIAIAMVGLLNAPLGTRLFQRLKSEKRLLSSRISGNNMDGSINFIPKMNYHKLMEGYKSILRTIYSQKHYYERLKVFLREYVPSPKRLQFNFNYVLTFLKLIWKLGIVERGRRFFWKLFFFSLFKYPNKFLDAVTMAIYGFHFRRVVEKIE